MKFRILPILLVLLLLTTTSYAQWFSSPMTQETNDIWSPALASSPDGLTVLAYATSGDPLLINFIRVMTFDAIATDYFYFPDPLTLASGNSVEICWSRTGFHAAVNGGDVVTLYHADHNGNWNPEAETILSPNGIVSSIDLWGVPSDAAGPDVFMTIETWSDPPYGNRNVQFASHNAYGWSELETVVSGSEMKPWPQITWSLGPAGPFPTIFFISGDAGESHLEYTTKDLSDGWSTPQALPEPNTIQGEFDIVTRGLLERNIIGLGAQPTCPCGSIHHRQYDPSEGWLPAENMTQTYAHYDWPMSPKIVAGNDGRVHAFWYQKATAHDFTPSRRTLEYQVLENGTWTDQGDFLDEDGHGGPFGNRVAISLGMPEFPVLAWTRTDTINGTPQPEQIWVGRIFDLSPVPENSVPQHSLKVSAWPNPFNPMVKIAFETDLGRTVQLDIFDARGRRVAQLSDQTIATERTVVTWDGTDDLGRNVPSGVYFARVISAEEQAVVKLVLAE